MNGQKCGSGAQTHGPKHHWQPQPFTPGPHRAGVSGANPGTQDTSEIEEGEMGIPGGIKVPQTESLRSSKKKQGTCGKVPDAGRGRVP